MARIQPAHAGGENVVAFLDMLAVSEGTSTTPGSDDGYNVLVGGELFQGYADHPRKLVRLERLGISSTAAGRYQLLARYYDAYKTQLKLPDFGPLSQDLIAIQQIRERRAIALIQAGKLAEAISECKTIWASLPGAGYGQHEQSYDKLASTYLDYGGAIA